MKPETPVLLLTGYLGSGKTTLVNRILSNRRGIKFAVIVNDIGEVNIDADLIQKGGGHLCSPSSSAEFADGIRACLSSDRKAMGAVNVQSVKKYDLGIVIAEWEKIYKDVL